MNSRLEHSPEEQELSALMRKTQTGDRASYSVLLEKVQQLLKPFIRNALSKMKQDAGPDVVDDLIQETLLGIHSKRDTYDPSLFFLPWMYAIARYKVTDYYRFRKNHSMVTSVEVSRLWETIVAPESNATAPSDAEVLLKELPEKQRTLLTLVKLKGFSIQEAAFKTGFSVSDVKVSLHRGLKLLQTKLNEQGAKHE